MNAAGKMIRNSVAPGSSLRTIQGNNPPGLFDKRPTARMMQATAV